MTNSANPPSLQAPTEDRIGLAGRIKRAFEAKPAAPSELPEAEARQARRRAKCEVPPEAPQPPESMALAGAVPLAESKVDQVDSLKTPSGKTAVLMQMLQAADGATLDQMIAATGWQKHSVRGFMSGTLKKKHGFEVVSEVSDAGRVYRIVAAAEAPHAA